MEEENARRSGKNVFYLEFFHIYLSYLDEIDKINNELILDLLSSISNILLAHFTYVKPK
jgi:hypothetical protein